MPADDNVIRIAPPLIVTQKSEIDEALQIIETTLKGINMMKHFLDIE